MHQIESRVFQPMLVALLFATVCRPAAGETVVIANTRIIDVRAGSVLPAADVEIRDSRIARIAPAGSLRVPDARVLDAQGGYLSPGFWDMHAHVNAPGYAREWVLPQMLMAGITGLRDMGGDCWQDGCEDSIAFMRSLQAAVSSGEVAGPRMVAIGSAVIDGPREREEGAPEWTAPGDAAQAVQLVRELKRRGVDFIKPYDTLPRAAYFAMMREAQAQGLPVGGHVPLSVSTLEAIEAGQATIDHAKHPLLDCSVFSGELRRIYADWAEEKPGAAATMRVGNYYGQILAGFDAGLCAKVIAGMARSRSYYVPTVITRKFEALADEPGYLADARLASVPPQLLDDWREDAGNYQKRFKDSPAQKRAYVKFYEESLRLVGEAHAAGVRVLVGTDATDSYSFPGSGYHDELRELAAAGLPNAAILRAATWDAAQSLGREAQFGSVEVGKTADLVLLAGNPLQDIGNARKVRAVLVGGKVFDAAELKAIEVRSQTFVDSLPVPTAEVFAAFSGDDRPGCAVGVMRDGRLIDSAAYGMSDLAARVPLTPDSVFNIASVSKQFTAFAILLLEQRGLLSQDDSITKFIPELGGYAKPVTLRQLLHHTGGLRDYYDLLIAAGHTLTGPTTREQALQVLASQRNADFPPNSKYEYSNTGYFLLGVTIERLSRMPLRQFMAQHVFDPLGMRATSIVDHYPAGIALMARGYSPATGGFALDESPWEQTGDGQVHTTVGDMAKWESNFITGALGGASLIARLHETVALASGERILYAAGVRIGEYRGLPTIAHGGDWAGYQSHYRRFPGQKFAVVVLCNRSDVDAARYTAAVSDRYLAAQLQDP